MGDIEKFIDLLKTALHLIYGNDIPAWIPLFIGWGLIIVLGLLLIWGILFVLSKIKELLMQDWMPTLYNKDTRERVRKRRQFADHIEGYIRRLNSSESWSDYRFAELEAEVEIDGSWQVWSLIPFVSRIKTGVRRLSSLSKALAETADKLILLQGDPGSGKSVALRFVTQKLAKRAMNARVTMPVIPLYINLRELPRPKNTKVDHDFIKGFVLRSLNNANDRDIEEFLDEEFDKSLLEGKWLFLFDSFDEIPEILSSTHADPIIEQYTNALSDFLHGFNKCRGVVASRQFRSPSHHAWPNFRILPLSEKRQINLISKSNINSDLKKILLRDLELAPSDLKYMSSNPMFLGLLCDYISSGNSFPRHPHQIFESYIEGRLLKDQERVKKKYAISSDDLRTTAEKIAFCMTESLVLGLSPSREEIRASLENLGFSQIGKLDMHLDALEYIKLARFEVGETPGDKRFIFSHRRFQEYFATRILIRESARVTPARLLTDGRWRETAVVLLQTQPTALIQPLIESADLMLEQILNNSEIKLINDLSPYENADSDLNKVSISIEKDSDLLFFPWPKGAIHLLDLLQSGFRNRYSDLPELIRLKAAKLIVTSVEWGTLYDNRLSLLLAGILPQNILRWLLRKSFDTKSAWLQDVAFFQAAFLAPVPADISQSIRETLIRYKFDRNLRVNWSTLNAYVSRIQDVRDYMQSVIALLRLLYWFDTLYWIYIGLWLIWMVSSRTWGAIVSIVISAWLGYGYQRDRRNYTSWVAAIFVAVYLSFFARDLIFAFDQFSFEIKLVMSVIACIFVSYFWAIYTLAPSAIQEDLALRPIAWIAIPFQVTLRRLDTFRKESAEMKFQSPDSRKETLDRLLLLLILPLLFLFDGARVIPKNTIYIIELLRYWSWNRNAKQALTGKEFLDLFARFTDERVAIRYVRFVRQHELLTVDKESLAVLLLMIDKQKERALVTSKGSDVSSRLGNGINYLVDIAELFVLYCRLLLLSIKGQSYPRWEFMNMPFWDELLRLFDETMIQYTKHV